MQAKDRLLKNVLIFSVGNLGSRFLVFFLVPLFSFYLTTSDMGFYDMVVVSVGVLIPIASMQLSESVYRWLLDSKNKNFEEIISSSILTLAITVLCVFLLFILSTFFFNLKYKFLIGGYFIVLCIYPYFLAVARGMRMNKLYALSGIINSIILVLSNWLLLTYFSLGVQALLISNIVACLLAVFVLIIGTKIYKYISVRRFSKVMMIKFIRYSSPLIPNAVSWWLINSANRFIILYFLGQESNGVYALASRLAMVLYAVNSIFSLAWQESAITEFDKEHRDKFYSDIFNKYFVLELTIVALLIPISKIFVLNFVGEDFRESWRYIPILFIGVAFAAFSAFFGTGYLSAKKTSGAFITTLTGAIINLIVAVILLPLIGLQGAAISIALGFVVTWVFRVYQTKKYFVINFNIKKMILVTLIAFSSTVLVFFVNNLYLLIGFTLTTSVLFYILNRILLNSILKKITGILIRK